MRERRRRSLEVTAEGMRAGEDMGGQRRAPVVLRPNRTLVSGCRGGDPIVEQTEGQEDVERYFKEPLQGGLQLRLREPVKLLPRETLEHRADGIDLRDHGTRVLRGRLEGSDV